MSVSIQTSTLGTLNNGTNSTASFVVSTLPYIVNNVNTFLNNTGTVDIYSKNSSQILGSGIVSVNPSFLNQFQLTFENVVTYDTDYYIIGNFFYYTYTYNQSGELY
jgi:hypothetical protein